MSRFLDARARVFLTAGSLAVAGAISGFATSGLAMDQSDPEPGVVFVPLAGSANLAAGRSSKVTFVAAFKPKTCASIGRTRVSVGGIAGGNISTSSATRTIPASALRGGSRKCAGKSMRGTVVTYTPKRGFRGEDSFRVRVSYPTTAGRRTKSEGFLFNVR